MSEEPQSLHKLENCIKILGEEWSDMSDARFINEYNIKARLMNLLWNDPDLWFPIQFDPNSPVKRLPSAYAEWYTGDSSEKFDLTLLGESSVKKWALDIRYKPDYVRRAAQLPVLAAMEVKPTIRHPWSELAEASLDKLVRGIDAGQVKYGYLFVYYGAKKTTAGEIKEASQKYRKRWGSHAIKVYSAPCDNPSISPGWI